MPKLASPPMVAPKTWRALLAVAADFAALAPWEFMYDTDAVGFIDPKSGAKRIGAVLGNAKEVFAAVFYRREGLRWILRMLEEPSDPEDFSAPDGMDALKLEFVPKRELLKEDLAMLKAADFKPSGRGCVWPQFRSAEPGWHPWHINQADAEQILADLPRLTAFCKMYGENPELFENRAVAEIPFLPTILPERPLTPGDLDWHPLLPPPPTGLEPYQASAGMLAQLRALERKPRLACEFDCTLIPGGSHMENGRPCFGRFSLLVETQRGLVIGMSLQSGRLTPGEAAGSGLADSLLKGGHLPEKIFIGGSLLQPVLQPLCDKLQVELRAVSSLPALEEAVFSLGRHLMSGG